jgi:HK97 family phage prohead protease
MPYTIYDNADGCDGFAVIKIEDESIVPGGCHATQSEAAAHLAALEIAEAEARALDSYPPTEGMIEEAQRGLDWRNEYGRGGTEIGIARARDIVNRRNLPIDTWRRIKAYFDRHQVDREAEGWSSGEDGYPSNGRIAWALWGGDSAWSRATAILEDVSNDEETVRSEVEHIETRDADTYPLTPLQSALYGDLESVVEIFGQFDKTNGAHGSHFMEAENNPFIADGMVCASCAFYEGPRGCEVVAGDIDPNGLCKFWIIPEQLLNIEPAPEEPAGVLMEEEEMTTPPVRYSMLETEHRRINGRDVEFRTMEVGGLELRAADTAGGSPVFSGYAAVFNSPSEPLPFTETIAPGAFRRTLKSEREIRMFVNHDSGQPLATTRNGSLRLSEDARGLRAEADLPDTTAGRDLATLIESGVVHSMSFGFSIPRGGDSFSDNGQTRELREVILHEVSVVTGFPAYPATSGATVRTTEEIAVEEAADRGLPVALAQRIFDLNSKR